MFAVVLGLVVISVPLFLILFFTDWNKGFLTVMVGITIFHLLLAITTQALYIFSYDLILAIHSVVALVVLSILCIKKKQISKPSIAIHWAVVGVFLVIGFQLWSVHYSYTGTINTFSGPQEVTNNSYAYPYYSDEWVGVSLVNYSIEQHTLPLANPLWPDARFANPTFPFFSFVAELFLILQLNPLTAYPVFAIFSGLLICFLIYRILRKLDVGTSPALLAMLSIPYIVNGANLPGLWYFIPLTAGLIVFLFSLLSFASGQIKLAILYAVLAMVFYPPIIVFSLPFIIFSYLENKEIVSQKGIWITVGSIFSVFIIASVFIFDSPNLISLKDSILSMIFRNNLQSGIPKFNIFTIIPIWIILAGLAGIFSQIKAKKYWLVCLTFIGLAFWSVYSGTQKVFIIEYQRVVVITSIFFIIFAGLGFQYLRDFIYKKYQLSEKRTDSILVVFILLIFAIASPFYTRYTDWQKLVMQIDKEENVFEVAPSSPTNTYLIPRDLALFRGITGQRFLASPWKGLVIGVATGNYPVESKASTITNRFFLYSDFISLNCYKKTQIAKKLQIAYVYSKPFYCPAFIKSGVSREGLVLYRVSI